MSIAALVTTAKACECPKQLKCPLTDEWINMWYEYTMEYYSAIKKNEIMPFAATWMDLEILIVSAVRQKEKDIYHMISPIGSLNYDRNELIYEIETDWQTQRTDLSTSCQVDGGRMDWEFGISSYKLSGWINNRVLLYITGNYIQCPVINRNGKESEKESIYIYMCVCVCVCV